MKSIKDILGDFADGDFFECAQSFWETLGYISSRKMEKMENPQAFLDLYDQQQRFNQEHGLFAEWRAVHLLFQLTGDDFKNKGSFSGGRVDQTIIESYLFIALELKEISYSRTQLAAITRAVNRIFDMPAMILFKYNNMLTVSAIHRRIRRNDESRDVLEKVSLIKDIRFMRPHRAHVDILGELAFSALKPQPKNFVELHRAWLGVLNIKELNKKFYKELSQWYFWAIGQVVFPSAEKMTDADKIKQYHSQSLIRLLTRLLFVWFVKEKQLVPDVLFDKNQVDALLVSQHESRYYRAILQNLFFATLNEVKEKRGFRKDGQNMNATHLMRYQSYFKQPSEFIQLLEVVPFMNGGLFECLDKPTGEKGKQGGDVIGYIDGFSDREDNVLCVPDFIFFGTQENIDLSEELGTKVKAVDVKGLIDIFNSYKFTVAENTPLEEDIALDPELLGQVFENLLASYNPETGVTARKQTGSFYTPREIVDYMVDESLVAYFVGRLHVSGLENLLRDLLSYRSFVNPFDEEQTQVLIEAIDGCKILDPACGSGAFPMGILHKLVYCLHKLDPKNARWKERQVKKAELIEDDRIREKLIEDIEMAFCDNELDYGRKLYLIENCIHGVDIQPIATQISKLRFFISLIVEQKPSFNKENFGIRPLPNLETKFVAANTLIGIEKVNRQMSIFEKKEISELEEKLKGVRHRLFSAKTPATKRQLREEDEVLRGKIGALLVKDGFEHKTAQQLAEWNPYNQNASADFFDAEWMFGLGGFDVVIGNPPYVQIQKFSGQACQVAWQNQKYVTFVKTGDIYALFIEKGVFLLKENGLLVFITSNKWMRAGYGKALRGFLAVKTQPLKLIDFGGYQVFESATVDSNILIVQSIMTSNSQKVGGYKFEACTIQSDFTVDMNLADYFAVHSQSMPLMSADAWVIASNVEQRIKAKIEARGTPLKDWEVSINYGIKTGFNEAFIIDTDTKERLCLEDANSAEIIKPVLRGRDIKRYAAEWAGLWIITTFPALHLNIDNYPAVRDYLKSFGKRLEQSGEKDSRKKTCNQWFEVQDTIAYYEEFEKEKIVYSEIVKDSRFYFDIDNFYAEATSFLLTGENIKYLISSLNSKFVTWAFKSFYAGGGLGENGYRYKKAFLELLPIPKLSLPDQQPFIELVDKILSAKKIGLDTRELEAEIDKRVYALYDLTEEEINIIEGGK